MAYKSIGFHDETVKGSDFDDKPEMFKTQKGRSDIIRILLAPVLYFVHAIPIISETKGETVFWMNCAADIDDIINANVDNMAANCPACKELHESKDRYLMMIVWLQSDKGGIVKSRNEILPWSIPASKYETLREIAKTLSNGETMTSVELKVIGRDNVYQKCDIMLSGTHLGVPDKVVNDIKESHKVDGEQLSNPEGWILIKKLLAINSKNSMLADLRKAAKTTGGMAVTNSGGSNIKDDPLSNLDSGSSSVIDDDDVARAIASSNSQKGENVSSTLDDLLSL